jgi:hypothetical protein
MMMNPICPNGRPKTTVTTPPAASSVAIQAEFDNRLVTIGVSQAAAP